LAVGLLLPLVVGEEDGAVGRPGGPAGRVAEPLGEHGDGAVGRVDLDGLAPEVVAALDGALADVVGHGADDIRAVGPVGDAGGPVVVVLGDVPGVGDGRPALGPAVLVV